MQNTGSVNSKESPPKFKVGDVFDTVYPFKRHEYIYENIYGEIEEETKWIGGCHKQFEPADCGYGDQAFYVADGEGRRILEILAVVDMPGKWQRRIIYSCTMLPPEGNPRRGKVPYTVTEARFSSMIPGYFTEYEVEAK
ncbi:TPA: hypothetical protein ACQ39K_000482 [Yersinia enterocolitica]